MTSDSRRFRTRRASRPPSLSAFASVDQLFCRWVAAGLCHRDAVLGGVELPVAGVAEPVSGAVGGPDEQWCGAVVTGTGGSGENPKCLGLDPSGSRSPIWACAVRRLLRSTA